MTGWIIETFVASTLLMLLVLALRGPVRRAFGPQMAYALWLMPVIRMLMPPLPGDWQLTSLIAPFIRQASEGPGVVAGVIKPEALPAGIDQNAVTIVELGTGSHPASAALVAPTAAAGGPSLLVLAIGLWAIGALAFLAYHLIAHRRHCNRLLKAARVDRTVAQGRVRVIETDAVHGPLAFGVLRKYVAFPCDFTERYDEQERDLALAHELGHHVRGDLIANWVALIVLALHWFNPVAWRAFRAFRADQEMACDALVLAGRAQALRHAYGRAIVKSAHGGAVSAACHLHTINEVKGRLRMLSKTHKNTPARLAAGLVGTGALGLAALGLTASGTQAAETIKVKVEKVTGIKLGQDVPAPAAAPAPQAVPAPDATPEAPAKPEGPVKVRTYTYTVSADGKDQDKGKDGKRVTKIVMVHADGSQTENEMPDIEAIRASVPEVKNGKCPGDADKPVVENFERDGKKVMIICSNRIEKITVNAKKVAMEAKRAGLKSAMVGLRIARRSIENQADLNPEQRAKALKGIDEAIAEVEKDDDN
ncbi:M56 family metallopeptidase [Sphingomonas sp. HITSZ_GF]|uniref:M56 family metallopeptidase n=1 Tax=Sphingomonas sp. HITSZ_GF TaxID=3037247 RepID=UPI00240D1C23|nr:M56 family metallopeptidase [Sphingomonas sp. HITSZ_GF]MDG2534836.1 M56 family metallopeptidase [Sphingomonas sp. HITSZ_GF]